MLGLLAMGLSACSTNTTPTVVVTTRVATQTPWIIYVPVTTTPEPALATPLPTVGAPAPAQPTSRTTATRAPAVAVKPPTTKPSAASPAPVAVAPTATPAPKCSYGPVVLKEPEDNALRRTKEVGVGGDTFRFIFDPPPELVGTVSDSIGYKLVMTARKNGATVYIQNNAFLNGKYGGARLFIYDRPDVSGLANGEATTVSWNITVIQASGPINENDFKSVPPGVVPCGPASVTRNITLNVFQ